MKPLFCTLYRWISDHADAIALAALYTLLGALAAPLILCAAAGMYESAVRDTDYPHSGYCPDTPAWEEDEAETTPTTYDL